MDWTLKITRAALVLFVCAYLALALRNNCAPPPPSARAPESVPVCTPGPTRMLALPADAPQSARTVMGELAAQLSGSAILGEPAGEYGPTGLASRDRTGLLLAPEARVIGADERPYLSLALLRQCSGRLIASGATYIDRLGEAGAAAYLRSQLTSLRERAGPRLFFEELLIDPSLPEGFELELRAQLRRAALGSPAFDWYEPDLSARLGLPVTSRGPEDFRLFLRVGGTRAKLWTQTQVRGPDGENVLAERHELDVYPSLAFRSLPELVREAAAKGRPAGGAPPAP